MIQFKAAQEFIKEWIRPRLTAFEKRYPDFPIVKFIDDVFELERVFDGDDALLRSISAPATTKISTRVIQPS
jgi:hypothetical protein